MVEGEEIDLGFLKRIKIEWVMILIFFIVLVMFTSIFDAGRLIHDTPVNINAGDMFIFSAFTDLVRFEDDLKVLPGYLSGGADDAINFFSPVSGIIMAQLAHSVNAESYDMLIHINILALLGAALAVYFFLRKMNALAAILSLPFFLLIFVWPFNFSIHWGGLIGNVNMLIIGVTIYCLYYINKKWMFVVLGLINAASFLSHGREFQVINLAFAIYLLIWLIKDKIYFKIKESPKNILSLFKQEESMKAVKNYFYSVIITILAVFPWWPMLKWLSLKNIGEQPGLIQWAYKPLFHQVRFADYGIFLYLIIIGFVIAAIYLFTKRNQKVDLLSTIAILFFISGIFTILGNRVPTARAYAVITLLPILFLVFVSLIELTSKAIKTDKKIIAFVLFLIVIGIVFFAHKPQEIGSGSLIHPLRMDAIKWMRNNVDDTERILVAHCDSCSQVSIFSPSRKIYHIIIQDDYFNKIRSGVMSSVYQVHTFPVHNKIIRNQTTGRVGEPYFGVGAVFDRNICDYDLFYTEKQSQNEVVREYSLALANVLVNEVDFTVEYQNDLALILRNNNVGGPCFEDKQIVAQDG